MRRKASEQDMGAASSAPVVQTAEVKADNKKDLAFLGVRIPVAVHKRLYRAKALLEYGEGRFYGMGKLVERVLKLGLAQLEKDIGQSTTTY